MEGGKRKRNTEVDKYFWKTVTTIIFLSYLFREKYIWVKQLGHIGLLNF
jgi:hypothetical protein